VIRERTRLRRTQLGVRGELREHPHQRSGHRMLRSLCGRPHHLEDGIDRHPVRSIKHELAALGHIASHFDQAAQRIGPHFRDELRRAPPQLHRFLTADGLQLLGDLQQVADDHLVVGFALGMVVDRLGDHGRLGWWRLVLADLAGQRGARQPDPQLRPAHPRVAHRPFLVFGAALAPAAPGALQIGHAR
jgi:hypothetical protein